MSLGKCKEMLLLAADMDIIDDEEFSLLYDINKSKNATYPYWKYEGFDLDALSDDECLADFRFRRDDIYRLFQVLDIPEEVVCYNRTKFDGIQALCVFLRRSAYPC